MRSVRAIMAIIVILALVPSLVTSRVVHAGGHIGTALTDFSLVTPANSLLYATIQSTAPDQPRNVKTLSADIQAQPGFKRLLNEIVGSTGSSSSSPGLNQILGQVLGSLTRIFNGEFGLAVLPFTTVRAPGGNPIPRVHLLLDAGLQSGVTADQLDGTLALLGLMGQPEAKYRNLSVVSLDINKLLGSVAGSSGGMAIPANGPISGTFYLAVAGNDAVLASDLPTLKHAVDSWFGASPTIADTDAFQATVGTLPAARLLTLYTAVDAQTVDLLGKLVIENSPPNTVQFKLPTGPGSVAEAFSLSAESDGILANASPRYTTGSLAYTLPRPASGNAAASLLPDNTLAYLNVSDPGSLIRMAIVAAFSTTAITSRISSNGMTTAISQRLDPFKEFKRVTGLSLDDDILSWMHGDGTIALLPTGSQAYGANTPLTHLSAVVMLTVSDQAFVESKIRKISDAIQRLGGTGITPLQVIDVPGPNGEPLHMLAATPNGLGYTFYNGQLILGSALPADMIAIQRGSSGHSLTTNPLYQAALNHFGSNSYDSVLFVNLTRVRETIERIAAQSGADMASYNKDARPLLTAFKSLATVSYAGPNGGGALFIGIGR